MSHANFQIVSELNGYIEIKDIGPWDKHRTVTNDAEWVVERVHSECKLGPDVTLTYTDSNGQRGRLIHDGHGNFKGFAPVDATEALDRAVAAHDDREWRIEHPNFGGTS